MGALVKAANNACIDRCLDQQQSSHPGGEALLSRTDLPFYLSCKGLVTLVIDRLVVILQPGGDRCL